MQVAGWLVRASSTQEVAGSTVSSAAFFVPAGKQQKQKEKKADGPAQRGVGVCATLQKRL